MTPWERKNLRRICRRHTSQHRLVVRAQLLLELNSHGCVAETARVVGVSESAVRRWRDRFLDDGRCKALMDSPRTGRPVEICAVTRCEVISMACGKPADFGVPCRTTWTQESLCQALADRHPGERCPSRSSVCRILNVAHIRPHKVKMWLHSPDPNFRSKVTDICDIYLNPPEDAIVLCVDEKTGMQALGRKHPGRNAEPGSDARMDYEYVRNGTRKLIAAFDPRTGEVYGEVRPSRTAEDLVAFMDTIAEMYPEQPVHIIWDNLNIHHDGPSERWTEFNVRHGGRFHFHYTPIHASWVNQVELFFGILHKRVLRYGVFNSLEELDNAVIEFIDHWNAHECHPFKWAFEGYPAQTEQVKAA